MYLQPYERSREYEQARLTGEHCSRSAIFKCIRRCYICLKTGDQIAVKLVQDNMMKSYCGLL
jgi:hypothetical protein